MQGLIIHTECLDPVSVGMVFRVFKKKRRRKKRWLLEYLRKKREISGYLKFDCCDANTPGVIYLCNFIS